MIRDLIALSDQSRVWIYQADRELTYEELDELRPLIFNFLDQWTAHNQDLMTYGNIFHRRFLALFVDESLNSASGCSIDKSVKFIESIGQKLTVDFFDRMNVCFLDDEEIHCVKLADINSLYQSGAINKSTLFFDNLVKTKKEFLKSWLVKLDESWYKRFIKQLT